MELAIGVILIVVSAIEIVWITRMVGNNVPR